MSPRVQSIDPPYPDFAQKQFDRLMPSGMAPLALFTTLAADQRLFTRFMSSSLLDRGHLTLRQREIVIDRVTAACGSEYEWGVHVALFGEKIGLSGPQLASLVHGSGSDTCWEADDERVLLRICDALHRTCSVDDALWDEARAIFSEHALVEILMLAGLYRTVSFLTNGMKLPLEPWAARFPPRDDASTHTYAVTLRWAGNTGSGTSAYRAYSRDHELSAPDKPPIPGSSDPKFRGDPRRWSPEELLVASLSACHQLWYLHLCADAGVVVLAYEDHADSVMIEEAGGAGQFECVTLRPVVTISTDSDAALALTLHAAAHEKCFIARSMNFPVSHAPEIRKADTAGRQPGQTERT
jgi:organic hydroperoxide reductase OsmC/OhrA/alkylhydroperoxidase family enzyme